MLWSGLLEGLGFNPEPVRFVLARRRMVILFQEAWGHGGIETFVMNVLRGLDHSQYAFEFWSAYDWDNGYDEEIEALGGMRVTCFPGEMPNHLRRLLAGTRAWEERLARGDVDIVHVNAMDATTLVYVAIARMHDVPMRIAHSRNTSFAGGMRALKGMVHGVCRSLFGSAATVRLAYSYAAGEYMFGHRPFTFVPNGIDVGRFAFDSAIRVRTRKELGVGNGTLLIGSIGRLSYQKNPLFTVWVLAELVAGGTDACLLLVGNGDLDGDVASLAERLGVGDLYIHVPTVPDPERYYCAMDAFLMPSLFEGFGYALVEAQCAGLPCVASEAIQDEACVTDLVKRVPLADGAATWARKVVSMTSRERNRSAYPSKVAAAGFAVEASVSAVREVYDAE